MALPAKTPSVVFTVEDLAADDGATITLVALVGRITGEYKQILGGTALAIGYGGIVEQREYDPAVAPTGQVVEFESSPLLYNLSSTPSNLVGGVYEYLAYLDVSTEPGALVEARYRFQIDEDVTYTLDGDGRIPFSQVAVDDQTITVVDLGVLNGGTTGQSLTKASGANLDFAWTNPTKSWSVAIFDADTACATGDGAIGFCVPADMDGYDLTAVTASTPNAGTTGVMTVQARRVRAGAAADMLSTPATIDTGEYSTTTAAASAVVDTSNDDLAEGDLIYVDVDTVHTTPATGLTVTLTAGV